eukprot:GEZU01025802.1.p1 GENE.GEZU01025802.1~~GEZU01025802.1.p1  ORF type:complete len:113 (-),score=0.75 GEZU01025802.1:168-506(-)
MIWYSAGRCWLMSTGALRTCCARFACASVTSAVVVALGGIGGAGPNAIVFDAVIGAGVLSVETEEGGSDVGGAAGFCGRNLVTISSCREGRFTTRPSLDGFSNFTFAVLNFC